jgi:DNA repair exonuclease SbcCD nuclease subunit
LSRDIKFIHTADTHLGANWPAIASRDKVQVPLFGEAFGKVVDFAIKEHVDFIVHGGDLIDHPRPSVAAISRLLDELRKLRSEKIPLIITKGSHDASPSFFERMGGNWLHMLDRKLDLLRYVDVNDNLSADVKTDGGSVVRIYGLGDYGNQQEEFLSELIPKMSRGSSDYVILIIHSTILEMPQARGAAVSLSKISPLIGNGLVDYIALGHNHQRWEDDAINAMNPGSTEFTSFAEASKSNYAWIKGGLRQVSARESPKGFYFVRVEGEITTPEFRNLKTRDVRDVIVEFDEATPEEVVGGLVEALRMHTHPLAILRPIATGSLARQYQVTDIKTAEVVRGAADALYVAYPLLNFKGRTEPLVEYGAGMSHRAILELAFSTRFGRASKDVARLADTIVESYRTLGRKAQARVLQEIETFDLTSLKEGMKRDAEKA